MRTNVALATLFLYSIDIQLENENNKIPIIIVSKHMKFLEINVTKSVKYLFMENYNRRD